MRTSSILLLLAGCGGGSDISPHADGSLALPSVVPDVELSSSRKDLNGEISVSGSGENVTVKVTTDNGWFAARPSGTENVYKIYAESFVGPEHLARIQDEARDVVSAALGG